MADDGEESLPKGPSRIAYEYSFNVVHFARHYSFVRYPIKFYSEGSSTAFANFVSDPPRPNPYLKPTTQRPWRR